MKSLISFILLTLAVTANASRLKNDFSCEAKNKDGDTFQMVIQDIDYAQEVSIKKGLKVCNFQIESGTYNERGMAPAMLIRYKSSETCVLSKKIQPQKDGNISISITKAPKARTLALIDHDGLDCIIKEFNVKKLQDRFGK